MKSRATFLGHPVHQMLIVFPLGLLATAVIFILRAAPLDRFFERLERGPFPSFARSLRAAVRTLKEI